MNIKIVNKSSYPNPEYATEGSAGFDLRANIETPISISPLERVIVPTGLFMEIGEGVVGMVCPRSGLAAKHGITVTNGPGVVDPSYRGEVKVILSNISNDEFTIMPGDRIAQMVIMPYITANFQSVDSVDEMTSTERASGGFGSTGVK